MAEMAVTTASPMVAAQAVVVVLRVQPRAAMAVLAVLAASAAAEAVGWAGLAQAWAVEVD